MGWANCGDDSQGRPIGYAVDAVCDYPECNTTIHRGLAHACGNMHGETEYSCEGYFCYKHLEISSVELDTNIHPWEQIFCPECIKFIEEGDEERKVQDILDYWTEERINSAEPIPMERDRNAISND